MNFFTNSSYKSRNRWILIGTGLLLVILYFTNFRQTVDLYQQNQQLSEQIRLADSSPQKLVSLKRDVERLDDLIRFTDQADYKDSLIIGLENYCQKFGVTITQLPETVEYDKSDYQIALNQVKIKGDFIGLVKVVHQLNTQHRYSRISSLQFEVEENKRSRRRSLVATIFLQNIKKRAI